MATALVSTPRHPATFDEKHEPKLDNSKQRTSQVNGQHDQTKSSGKNGYRKIMFSLRGTADYFTASLARLGLIVKSKGAITNDRPHDVLADFNYHKGLTAPPCIVTKPETLVQEMDPQKLMVRNIRGEEDKHTLDTTGFQVVNHISKEKDFADDEQIKRVYYPEVETMIKSATGASSIFIFEHFVRRPRESMNAMYEPLKRVHIDRSDNGYSLTLRKFFPDDADRLLKSRHQIINAWQPIKTIRKDPLALMDATSILETDKIPQQIIFPGWIEEGVRIRHNPSHRWHYLREQTPTEVMLFKIYESRTDVKARAVPHSAFVNPEFEAEAPRESIEVRALVFYEDGP